MTLLPARALDGPGIRRGRRAFASALIAASFSGVAVSPGSVAVANGQRDQGTVALLHDHVARRAPNRHATRVDTVTARRPLTGSRTVLPVLGQSMSPNQGAWLRVRLPGRPNGHSGWISANRTRSASTAWRILVHRSTERVVVFYGGRARRHFRAVVGKPSTPTPRGSFFIEESLALSPYEAGGPYALATSARSNVFQEFEGGPGQIALHGTNNLTGSLGTAVSHGCIRLSTHAITWMARRIGAGVPITIAR
jgi:lipoprotein-anchoring transpeptidase ErfK/SrfK